MVTISPSPFARPAPDLRIKKGAPEIPRPSKEEIAAFPSEAKKLIDRIWTAQKSLLKQKLYEVKWIEGKHFVLAGATGQGLGGALATAVLHLLGDRGSLTVIARDLSRSIGYHSGAELQARAEKSGFGNRFHWINDGLAVEDKRYDTIVSALKEAGADRVIYINTVAAAKSGLVPGAPPVYVKDIDDDGLFQWELTPLDDRSIDLTKFIMGTLSVQFPKALEKVGITVDVSAYADWRGSLDLWGRDPSNYQYGRCGPYSTSLFLPKEIIQRATAEAYNSDKIVIDFFLPVMRTRALGFIPGGRAMASVYSRLMNLEGIQYIDVPELALKMLNYIGNTIAEGGSNPFPRFDGHEAPLELWFFEVLKNLNENEKSEFYYKRWINDGSWNF